MRSNDQIDTARLSLMLTDLRLRIAKAWHSFTERADTEGWPAAVAFGSYRVRDCRARNAADAAPSHRSTSSSVQNPRYVRLTAVPMVSKARVMALVAGDVWLKNGANLMLFGGPGGGKSHLAAAIGVGLIENGWRVLFTRTTDLVQKLQAARRNLDLEGAIAKLDKYHLLVLNDMAYVSKDQAETSVLFELISARYERRSILITANQPLGNGIRSSPIKR